MFLNVASLLMAAALGLPHQTGNAVLLPDGNALGEVSFEKHVTSLLGKLGCNAASCHGSFQGRGGFRLSLFGHDSEMDYRALTHEVLGRRVNRNDPDYSLVLRKASGQVPHGGGKRFDKNSWPYQVMRAWIAAGCPRGGSGEVTQIQVAPPEHALFSPQESVTLKVTALFADGAREDITRFCTFRAQDEIIANVSDLGEVRGLQPGETPIIVSYRGHLTAARVLIPVSTPPGFT